MCSLEKRGRVFVLTLTDLGEHRLNPELIASLRAALARARAESSRGCALVTTAEGRFFSNGFDLAWAQAAASPSAARDRLTLMVRLFAPLVADLLSLPMPTVAAVTGHVAAAGVMLALSHDYIEMRADKGVLYMSELDIGLPFPDYFLALMRAKISDTRALRDVTLRSAKIGAKEAAQRGIIDRAHAGAAEALEAAMKRAEELAARGWDGDVYATIRKGGFPELCRAVGLADESEEDKRKVVASKL